MLVTFPCRNSAVAVDPEHVVLVRPIVSWSGESNKTRITLATRQEIVVYAPWDKVVASLNAASPTQQIADWINGNGPTYFANNIRDAIADGMHQG